jgi:hypothetical protein
VGLHQAKKLVHNKEIYRIKSQPTKWEKVFAKYMSNKSFVSKIYKELNNKTI